MKTANVYTLLDHINGAEDVRSLSREQLPQLCQEVRNCLIDTVSKTTGHLASGLGVVELTVALHYVFNTPDDILVWDVGHQAYPHKILTGHRKEFSTIRQKDGLHAFIWRGETPYDLISTGHASTSIGSALGLAVAQRGKPAKERRKVVAIIGDGAISGGCAFEALNHAGSFDDIDLTVILNDNEWSISENVGSIAQGLSHVISSPHYVKLVEGGKRILEGLPAVRDLALRAQEHVKGMLMPGTLFEEFGFNYIGPIDGNNVERLVSILQNVRNMSGLNFLHIVTTKGKGYAPAEKDPTCYHGVPCFDPSTGIPHGKKEDLSFSAAFGRWLCDKAEQDKTLMGITPAMRIGSGMSEFARRFPQQFFDVAIAEQHAMVFASGLAAGGMRPVVNIYSSFMQRAYDGLIHDMAIQDLPIILALDRGGIVGPDGPTHNGLYDIAFTRTVPHVVIMCPATRHELYTMLNTAYAYGHPTVLRYPRASGESLLDQDLSLEETMEIGSCATLHLANFHKKAVLAMDEDDRQETMAALGISPALLDEPCDHKDASAKVAVLGFGPLVQEAAKYCAEQDFTLINMRFVKPLNEDVIRRLARRYEYIFTLEEGALRGGIGEAVATVVAEDREAQALVCPLGIPDDFIMEASRNQILEELRLDAPGQLQQITQFMTGAQL